MLFRSLDVVYAAYRGVIAPAKLSAAQIAFWDATLAAVSAAPDWKATALEHAWEPDYRNAAATRKNLDGEFERLKGVLWELGVMK